MHPLEAPSKSTMWIILVSFCFPVFLWRFWAFTIAPMLHPESPKRFPYWFPGRSAVALLLATLIYLVS